MKEQLALWIDAYSAARASGNAILQRYATQQLNSFLDGVDVTERPDPEPTTEEDGDEG